MQSCFAAAVDKAYPDRAHLATSVKHKLSSHSIRVIDAMAILNAGKDIKDISHQLHWNSDTIDRYVHEAKLRLADLCTRVIAGAQLT